MGEPDREEPERPWTRIGENRFAFAVVIATVAVLAVLAPLYRLGVFDPSLPALLPSITALPLYALALLFATGVVLWSWRRVASFFE